MKRFLISLMVFLMMSSSSLSFNVLAEKTDSLTLNKVNQIRLNEEGDLPEDPDNGSNGNNNTDPDGNSNNETPSSIIIIDDPKENNLWSANAYYIDEASPYHVHKEDDFHLIYQIEFHADTDIPKYAVRITVPSLLLEDRNGNKYYANDIAVPKAEYPVYDPETGLLADIDFTQTKNIGFNYYIEEIDGIQYYVFFNYKELTIGTSAAFQVLYKNLEIMELVDETSWTLPVTIDVTMPSPTSENTYIHQSSTNPDLTGEIDSSQVLTSTTKKAYDDPSKSYTPALYTKRQVDSYISWKDPDNYSAIVESNFSDYRYAVWESSIKVSDASQPYYVELDEKLLYGAKLVGISSGNSYQPLGVKKTEDGKYRIWDNNSLVDKQTDPVSGFTYQKERNITYTNVRLVIAYPRSTFDNYDNYKSEGLDYWMVSNELDVNIVPVDGKDPVQTKTSSSEFKYREYKYYYEGDGNWSSKSDAGSYNGWTNSWATRAKNGKDLGGIPFTFTATTRQYNATHYTNATNGHSAGDIREDIYVRLTAVDDLLYISKSKGSMDYTEFGPASDDDSTFTNLERGDYYYEAVKVTVTDTGYDVFEDTTIDPSNDPTYVNRGTKIYAMYEYDEGLNKIKSEESWELVADITSSQYVFSADQIARHPYRVMAIHESNGYTEAIRLDLSVALIHDSKTVKTYIINSAEEGNNNVRSVTLENNAGIITEIADYSDPLNPVYSENRVSNYTRAGDAKEGKAPSDSKGNNYTASKSSALYPEDGLTNGKLPVRFINYYGKYSPNTQGFAYLNNANPFARTNKYGTVENDAVNARINVKYNIVAYDGYEIYNESVINYMKEANNDFPGHREVVFYDLLPLGMEFDPSVPVVAGRLTDANEKQVFKYPESWDKKNVTVTVDPDKDVITNFNGTGQTLVTFHVKYNGVDPTVYTVSRDINNTIRNLWIEGFGVSYGAYYIWENVMLVESKDSYNVFGFTTDKNESNKDIIGKGVGASKAGVEAYVYSADQSAHTINQNDPSYQDLIKYIPSKSDIWDNTSFEEILFGKGAVKDIYAKSSQAEIIKGVRADSDGFGSFSDEAEVKLGESYTYEIIVRTAEQPLNGLVVYDQIENTIDVKTPVYDESGNIISYKTYEEATATKHSQLGKTFDKNSWYGTFEGINTKTLILQGVKPKIYYSVLRNATVPRLSGDFDDMRVDSYTLDPSVIADKSEQQIKDIIKQMMIDDMEDGKWIKESLFLEYFELSDVKAYSIDLREGLDGNPFVLPKMTSISYYFSMKSPDEMQNSIDTASEKRNTSHPELFPSADGKYEAADWAYNNAAYSASFASEAVDSSTLLSNSTRVRQIENDRLIIEKHLSDEVSVPSQFENNEFVFTVMHKLEENSVLSPFANKSYYLEKYDGENWNRVQGRVFSTDVNGKLKLKADERAVFKTSASAIYEVSEEESPFWKQDVEYVNDSTSNEFTVNSYSFTNTFRPFLYVNKGVSDYGTMDTSDIEFEFTLYKLNEKGEYVPAEGVEYWKVTSSYSDATIPERVQEYIGAKPVYKTYKTDENGKFSIGANKTVCMFAGFEGDMYKVVENIDESSDWVLLTDKEVSGTLEVVNNIVNFKNRYRLRDLYITKQLSHYPYDECSDTFSFKVVEIVNEDGTEKEVPLNGNKYFILDADKNKVSETEDGTLDENGIFTAAIGFKSVLIEGLEFNKTYGIYELVAEDGTSLINSNTDTSVGSEYRPLVASRDVKMPVYSMSKEVSFTNDYLLRPLSVTKTVVSRSASADDTEYVMRAYVDLNRDKEFTADELLTNKTYITNDGLTGTSKADGTFTIKGSQTLRFDSIARQGYDFKVEELWNGGFIQIYPVQKANEQGTVPLHEDGTALIEGKEYQTPLTGTFEAEGAGAMIINGEAGVLLIGKEYVAQSDDVLSSEYIASLKSEVNTDTTSVSSKEAVTLTLKIKKADGSMYTWPENDKTATVFNLISGASSVLSLSAGSSFRLDPWVRVLVDDLEEGSTYILSEAKEDSSKMYDASKIIDGANGFIDIKAESDTVNGDPSLSPLASIINRITSYSPSSRIMKYMKPGSDEVIEGEGISFRVERYSEASKTFTPAKDVRYIISEYDAKIDETYMTSPLDEEDLFFYTDKVLSTASDGKISYYKQSKKLDESEQEKISLYPVINFIDDIVYLCLDENKTQWNDGDLRLIETMNESDESWGQWYCNEQFIDSTANTLKAIVSNSNRAVKMDLTKKLLEDEIDDGRSYTFLLKQVTKLDDNSKPLESIPGASVSYEVLDPEGNVIDTRKTAADGKITLKVDETARILFADSTVWTFEEVQDSVYRLAEDVKLKTDDDTDGQVLSSNLALVGAKADKIPVLIVATPDYIYAVSTGGEPSNNFSVELYYSDGSSKEISLKNEDSLGYEKTYSKNADNSWNVHFTYTEKDTTVETTVKLLPRPSSEYVVDYSYTGSYEEFTAPKSGYYLLETWGAKGGDAVTSSATYSGGMGAYASGMIYLAEGEKLYIAVGGKGKANGNNQSNVVVDGGYNGGGPAYSNQAGGSSRTASGGGATSIQKELVGDGQLKNYDSNRNLVLMVAGGGGGANYWNGNQHGFGGHGGGINGLTGYTDQGHTHKPGTGGTQTAGGYNIDTRKSSKYQAGSFGVGGSDLGVNVGSAGGGGGYYGGGPSCDNNAGGGGSGYINGYDGCNSEHTNDDYLITSGKFIMGGQEMPLPDGTTGLGNNSDGHARISLIEATSTTYNYTGEVQTFTAQRSGYYLFEAWGAQGSSKYEEGGHGGYTSGYIFLENGETVFIYVGNTSDYLENAYNGGIAGSTRANVAVYTSSGGGATDFRLASDSSGAENWNDFNSLKSRIMVAAGGGGSCKYSVNTPGGYAGGLTAGPNYFSNWVDQPRGVVTSTNGTADQHGGLKAFNDPETHDGKVRNPVESIFGSGNGSGSGGGYYGGVYYGISARVYSGGGGSSYVSGYPGCISIAASSTSGHIVESGSASHYSGRTFIEPVIKSGNEMITEPDGTASKGHKGNGVARVTYIGDSMDYIFLEYLESDGSRGNYIDLGFNMLAADYNDYKYDVTFSISDSQNSNSVWHTVLEPEYIDEDTAIYRILFGNSNNLLLYSNGRAGGGWTHNTVLTPFEKYNVILDVEDGQMKNTLTKLSDNSSSTLTRGISTQKKDENNLFAFANTPTSDTTLSGKIFGIKVYKNDKLIHNFVPSKNTLLNKYGFYDKVSNVMHYANGTINGN